MSNLGIDVSIIDGGDIDPKDIDNLKDKFIFYRAGKKYEWKFDVINGKPGISYKEVI